MRTLAALRAEGWTVDVCERWIPGARVRRDLFGLLDIVALKGDQTMGVQCTSSANMAARVKKLAESENIGALREAGWTVEVWGWRKSKPSGKWVVRRVDVS